MKIRRIGVATAVAATLALPVLATPAATAAVPASGSVRTCNKPPSSWGLHTQALTIRSRPTTHSVALGILYKGQRWSVHSWTSGESWVNITDRSTGVRGWVSGAYFYRIYYTCLA